MDKPLTFSVKLWEMILRSTNSLKLSIAFQAWKWLSPKNPRSEKNNWKITQKQHAYFHSMKKSAMFQRKALGGEAFSKSPLSIQYNSISCKTDCVHTQKKVKKLTKPHTKPSPHLHSMYQISKVSKLLVQRCKLNLQSTPYKVQVEWPNDGFTKQRNDGQDKSSMATFLNGAYTASCRLAVGLNAFCFYVILSGV